MKKHGPWQINDSVKKYENPWLELREDQVIRPDQKQGIYSVITMRDGASVAAVDAERNIFLTKEFRYAIGKESIEVVSGGIDKNEKPLEAAKRELKEEMAISAKRWTDLGVVHPFTSMVESAAYLFLAQDLSFSQANPEETELIEVVKIPLKKAVEMVYNGTIQHAQSCVCILKAWNVLQNNK